MVFCGICKENKETRNRWMIHEHAADNSLLRDFKVCDDCAAFVIRKIIGEMKSGATEEVKADLMHSGLLDNISLTTDNALEITLLMDLAKARKIILEQTEAIP